MRQIQDVTVAVATRGRPESLSRCLDALLDGEVLPAEVLVVDQGDDERTCRLFEELRPAGVAFRHLRQRDTGLARSRNAAIREASMPVVAVTDDDCVPSRGWLASLMRTLAAADAAAVTGSILPLGPDAPGRYPISSRLGREVRCFSGRALPWAVGSGANFAFRQEWIERIGGYDERLGTGSPGAAGEDADVIYRLLRAGGWIHYEPQAVVYHERRPRAGRRATRGSYGFGIGACCGIWLRSGDPYALLFLGRWLLSRARRGLTGALRLRHEQVSEELLVFAGTFRGFAYGIRTGA